MHKVSPKSCRPIFLRHFCTSKLNAIRPFCSNFKKMVCCDRLCNLGLELTLGRDVFDDKACQVVSSGPFIYRAWSPVRGSSVDSHTATVYTAFSGWRRYLFWRHRDRDLRLRSQALKAMVFSPLEMVSMVHWGRSLFNVSPSQVHIDLNGEHPAWAYDFKSLSWLYRITDGRESEMFTKACVPPYWTP